jgi:hypothetical protein
VTKSAAKEKEPSKSATITSNSKVPARPKSPRKPKKKLATRKEVKASQPIPSTSVDQPLSTSRKPGLKGKTVTEPSISTTAIILPITATPLKPTNSTRPAPVVANRPPSVRENAPVTPKPVSKTRLVDDHNIAGDVARTSSRKHNAPTDAVPAQNRAVPPMKPRNTVATSATSTHLPILRRSPRKIGPVLSLAPLTRPMTTTDNTCLPTFAMTKTMTSRPSAVANASSVQLSKVRPSPIGMLALPGENEDLPLLRTYLKDYWECQNTEKVL